LRGALIELIEERGFDRVTVGEITSRAMVSRAAFYRNYRDKFQLVEQIFDEAVTALIGSMSDGEERSTSERWASFFDHIAEYDRVYGALLGKSGSPWFANRMRATLADMARQHLPVADSTNGRSPASMLAPTLIAAMFVEAITWWLENDRPCSAGQIAERSGKIAAAMIAEAQSWSGDAV
jgi:AcrR family transcriptional regulator